MYNDEYNYGVREVKGGVETYISKVFGWMFVGLILTAFVAFMTASNIPLMKAVINPVSYILLTLVELGLVIFLSARIEKLSVSTATGLFLLYSAVNGLTLSAIFLAFHLGVIFQAFLVAAVVFGVMAVYGYVTKTDLTYVGNLFVMGVIGILIASLINMFFRSSTLGIIISYIGLFLFLGLTAYDTQKIKSFYAMGAGDYSADFMKKGAIISALALYLDFINIFLFLLSLFGGSED